MFKTLDESISKEKATARARIVANGDKLADKRDAALKAARGTAAGVATKTKAVGCDQSLNASHEGLKKKGRQHGD